MSNITPRRVVPELGPGGRVEGVDVAVLAPHVDDAVGDGGGGVNITPGRVTPELGAGLSVEGIEGGGNAHIHDAVGDGRRGDHIAFRLEAPLQQPIRLSSPRYRTIITGIALRYTETASYRSRLLPLVC